MYVFAAFAPSLGRLISLVLPTANTATMNLFLEHLSQALADYFKARLSSMMSFPHLKVFV